MDKQLIERITTEAMISAYKSVFGRGKTSLDALSVKEKRFMNEVVSVAIERIDAERGEGAIGYVEKHMIERIKEFGFAHVEVSTINRSSSRVPIFLSPTIPECLEAEIHHRIATLINKNQQGQVMGAVREAIAAAQGEQK